MSCVVERDDFDEVRPGVYRNNTFSEVLRFSNPATLKSAVEFVSDEGFRAASRLLAVAKIPAAEKQRPALPLAYGFEADVFDWMATEPWRGQRLTKAIQQLHKVANSNVSESQARRKLFLFNPSHSHMLYPRLHFFFFSHPGSSPHRSYVSVRAPYTYATCETNKLPAAVARAADAYRRIVDIGADIGSLEMMLLETERNKHLEFVLFDIPQTAQNAEEITVIIIIITHHVNAGSGMHLSPPLPSPCPSSMRLS
ncbi:hypothetical protein FISHEDRAFT_70293 [Fistulina hepatica ATCC 64428]|uniref:O-methyltransferase domain-containing protein n=1 Tax=Fistulina hepatica ATCC 64428 TaxID=1128425 RepID=A0A0D7AMP3_9AGAR|nr:hypothetical protein FISHEDRAFT_70293 [Fistulina hepatica ATCC 64428]